jgi:hypothetical protein
MQEGEVREKGRGNRENIVSLFFMDSLYAYDTFYYGLL